MVELMGLVRHATRWLLRHRHLDKASVTDLVDQYLNGISAVYQHMDKLLLGKPMSKRQHQLKELTAKGVPDDLANRIASADAMFFSLDAVAASQQHQCSIHDAAEILFQLSDSLSLNWFRNAIDAMPVQNRWHLRMRDAYRDDVDLQLISLVNLVLSSDDSEQLAPRERVKQWINREQATLERWQRMQAELKVLDSLDASMFAVAIRELATIGRRLAA